MVSKFLTSTCITVLQMTCCQHLVQQSPSTCLAGNQPVAIPSRPNCMARKAEGALASPYCTSPAHVYTSPGRWLIPTQTHNLMQARCTPRKSPSKCPLHMHSQRP